MSNQNKFEAMLEKLIADDRAGAEDLFHEIVVEKSRDIYEGLLESDVEEVEVEETAKEDADDKVEEKEETADEDKVDEASKDDDEDKVDEATDEDEEKTDEAEAKDDEDAVEEDITDVVPEGDDDMGGDPVDDMMADIEGGDDEEDNGDEDSEDLEDRVADLEDTFDDLKAEFDAMMSDEDKGDDDGEEGPEMDMDAGDDEGDEEADEGFALEPEAVPAFEKKEMPKDQTELMREYVQKVSDPSNSESNVNTKSTVASKNDMGGTAANIAKGGEGGGSDAGLADKSPKEDNAGNVNVPGGKASKSLKSDSKGHGAEKKGAGETGTDKKSLLGK